MMKREATTLRQILGTRFDEGELRTLCFDLNIDYADLAGEGRAEKARELVYYLERRNRISDLVAVGSQLRPDIAWERISEKSESLPSPSSRSQNPFCDRGRINVPARFFDRQHILRELRQMLAAGNSVSLVGNTEVGKSSLLYYLYQTRAEWLPIAKVFYLDLQGVLDEQDFCVEVLEGLGHKPGGLRTLKRTLRQGRTVLLIDEVEKLADPAFSTRLHDLLRALAQEPTLTLAVASHQPLADIFPPDNPTSPFHNIFSEKRLEPFTPKDAHDFLVYRTQSSKVTFTPEEIERLVSESGCHPARLQRLAHDLFEQKGY